MPLILPVNKVDAERDRAGAQTRLKQTVFGQMSICRFTPQLCFKCPFADSHLNFVFVDSHLNFVFVDR